MERERLRCKERLGKGEGRGAQAKQERCFVCRKRWKDEVLGVNEGDDVDCLFFILARSLTDQQKGKCCVHKTKMASILFSADVILCFYISACACSLMPRLHSCTDSHIYT